MPRRREIARRDILPDPLFNSQLVTRFVNVVMRDGKKATAERILYDALETNDSAVKVLGDETLKTIARELVETVRRNVTIDWTVKESVRAKLRVVGGQQVGGVGHGRTLCPGTWLSRRAAQVARERLRASR